MIFTLIVAAAAIGTLFLYVLKPLREGAVTETVGTERLVEEAEERKTAAIMAILDIEDENAVGKLSDGDLEVLRNQYAAEALRALRELDAMGATVDTADDALEREIARLRQEMTCPHCGAIRPEKEGPCPACGRA